MSAITQREHIEINRKYWPGTRQLCVICGEHTEHCEEDAIYLMGKDTIICHPVITLKLRYKYQKDSNNFIW